MKSRFSEIVLEVGIRSGVQKQFNDIVVPGVRRIHQWGPPVFVRRVDIDLFGAGQEFSDCLGLAGCRPILKILIVALGSGDHGRDKEKEACEAGLSISFETQSANHRDTIRYAPILIYLKETVTGEKLE